jgi:GntR family transcriptional regulator
MFDISPSHALPIWRQIEEGLRRMISLGSLSPGDAVPSVRELAQQLRVNPNTVARVYQRLTEQGVLTVRRGEGTFVADQPRALRKAQRSEALRQAANAYAGTALAMEADLEQAVEELEAAFRKMTLESRRNA